MAVNIHHIEFYVSNAKQVVFVFKSPISPDDPLKIGSEVALHGDFVKNVVNKEQANPAQVQSYFHLIQAYSVENLDLLLKEINRHGQHSLLESKHAITDANGTLLTAKIDGSAGSLVHTLIQNVDYRGPFLPGFEAIRNLSFCDSLCPIPFCGIDHVVEAHPENSLENVAGWYKRTLQMHRFWSIDDKLVRTNSSALKAVLMGNEDESVKVTLVEPVHVNGAKRGGQVQEFLDSHGDSGIQHIAFLTDDIIATVHKLRERGVEFLEIPTSYYKLLNGRLSGRGEPIQEDLTKIRELGILVDFDEQGYLLQIFTKPVQDRATLFLEVIQRHNFNGFGAGNFKALFEAVDLEQKRREQHMEGAASDV